ncbi:ankyrin repeat domain-containing protein 7-like, partial [Corapipo altera]|uniref:ankyrin repeat domain-containing protein 7-like n=1 Tax=Corapipo altera TaxID=415028 RepID=UPI000FD63ADA
MKAVQQEQEECVAVLLEHSADPNLADADGNTALHLAVLSKNTAVAGLLLEHHANSDAQNQWGFTPFQLAALQQHEEMECLLKQAADRPAQGQGE